jgi:heat shock protein HslJ
MRALSLSMRRGARALGALAVLAALAVGACTTGGSSPTANLPLEGTLWQLASYVGPEGGELQVPDGLTATARLESGSVAGNGGCNEYTGTYTLDGDALTFGPVASTRMACAGPGDALETAYFAAIGRVESYVIDDVTLVMKNADGDAILTFEEGTEASLTGTEWVALYVNNGNQGVESVVAGTEVTATFAEDGTVAGSGGCNDYSGTYTVDGSGIEVGPLASTQKLCASPEGIDAQEAAYFAALDAATTWQIAGDTLELRDDAGSLQVSFVTR